MEATIQTTYGHQEYQKTSRDTKKGLEFPRVFSQENIHPYEKIAWTKRDASITNDKGELIFCQKDIEVPEFWSQMAIDVVASKYFRGGIDSPEREKSVKELVSRVADTIAEWGRKDQYFSNEKQERVFREELTSILVEQYAAFNSPVWFNVGVEEHPQCSACFILSVDDSIDSLLELQLSEARLFKYGSGAGSNLSNIRSKKERLSGGGIPSGPVSFMRGFDSWAGTIKSGGKTRRAAKMQILDVDHPDIFEFVDAKTFEEKKAWALIEQGYDGGFNIQGGAYDSVFFQNSNLSVRASDEFMQAVVKGKKFATRRRTDGSILEEIDAQELLRAISQGTWVCGDPGLQFDTIINNWHTCPKSGRINASNPCSEYMHVDDSACNLASINLLKFLNEDGSFELEKFLHVVDILITAQDILVDNASYPMKRIGDNAHAFRQLGLGYANLGAFLMSNGVAYDSDEGRQWAATLTALLCGEAYLMSTKLAEELGAFSEYKKNEKEMLKVIQMHKKATKELSKQIVTETLVDEAQKLWDEALAQGNLNGFRNSQTTVLAPTGTIAFLMDCDTTGVEPDISLVKYKKLSDGGVLKIVNQSVTRALCKLSYSEQEIHNIIAYIDKNDSIEGAPELKEEHLSIFDCAFCSANSKRSIHYMGHLKMMAAAQPFISGAISKTVNLPHESTIEDIYKTYIEAWKLGLKAVAIYRDGSKRSQPLSTKKENSTQEVKSSIQRRRLPDERDAITHKFSIAGHEGYITAGLYEDGTPGEIFVVMAKEGSTLSGVMDAFATSISLALQYGVPLATLIKKFAHMRFEPSGMTQNKAIPFAKSILDYIFRWLATKFLSQEEQAELGIQAIETAATHQDTKPNESMLKSLSKQLPFVSDDAPPCTNCGSSLMVRQGACYRCLNCGTQGGCG